MHGCIGLKGCSVQVNVIHGCNERCTYCVVPNTRGVEQSRTPEAIRVRLAVQHLSFPYSQLIHMQRASSPCSFAVHAMGSLR